MTRRWVDEWPDLEPKEVERPSSGEAVAIILIVGTVTVVTSLTSYALLEALL